MSGPAPQASRSAAEGAPVLPREITGLLIALSIGVHRFAMYPPGHGSLAPAVEDVLGRLEEILTDQEAIEIGVAQRRLVVDGVASDARHPVLSDLARRLHRHDVGALAFARGIQAPELEAALAALARDPERDGQALGATAPPSWTHVHLHGVGYDRLSMEGGVGARHQGGRATDLWLDLARAALTLEEPPQLAADASVVARAVSGHRREASYEQLVAGHLLELTEELKGDGRSDEVERIRDLLSTLVEELDDETLARLVDMGGNAQRRRRFLHDAGESLAADAVLKILKAAATASSQDISTSMTRLLSKMAAHAGDGGRVARQADAALRDNVEELMAGWELKDPNPDAYTLILDEMARAAPVFEASASASGRGEVPGAQRLMEMALEVDAWGPIVRKAVHDLLGEGRAGFLLTLVEGAPEGNRLAERVRKHMISPEQFKRVLAGEDVDERALTALVRRMGSAAVDPLLDVLSDSDSLPMRRKVFDQLAGLGPFVAQRALERLDDPRWFVQRNMLALLQRLRSIPEALDLGPFLGHADARVRREAFPLALRVPQLRDRGLVGALSDEDERMVRMALLELRDHVAETLVPTLVHRVVKAEGRSAELRAMGARALRHSRSHLALEALLGLASRGRSLLGRARLTEASPEAIAALKTLAEVWAGDERAAAVLRAAARSRDEGVRAAVTKAASRRERPT